MRSKPEHNILVSIYNEDYQSEPLQMSIVYLMKEQKNDSRAKRLHCQTGTTRECPLYTAAGVKINESSRPRIYLALLFKQSICLLSFSDRHRTLSKFKAPAMRD